MESLRKDKLWEVFDEQSSAIPGGTSIHPAVLRNMQRPYVNPWSSEFQAYFDETVAMLKQLYNTRQDVLVMIGPIRLAMDAVVCSLLEPNEKVASLTVNGHWSNMFNDIASSHGQQAEVIETPWGLPVDPDQVRRRLDQMGDKNIKALFVTHVETSTGIVNPVEELGKVAKERGLYFVVDAAQTLGGLEVRMDDWGVDFCISGNHKCMSTPAGLSYMGISNRGWRALENRRTPIKGWYSNLLMWRRIFLERESGYFTIPANVVFGLRAALDLMFSMSLPELYRRYALVAKAIRYAASAMGLELVPSGHNCPGCDSPGRICADTATAIRYPAGIKHEDFAGIMHNQYGLSIAGTYGPLSQTAFRVGPTGLMQINRGFTLNLISCMCMAFGRLGFDTDINRVLKTADEILADF